MVELVIVIRKLKDSEAAAGRTQAKRREVSDQRMLRAATKLIGTRGVAGTTLAEVGITAGYSRGLPVDRFGNKTELLQAVLESMDNWLQLRLDKATKQLSGAAGLKARKGAHIESARMSPLAAAALYSIYVESLFAAPELRPRVSQMTERWRNGILANLREAQTAGEIYADVDCQEYASLILGTLRGLMIEHLIEEGPATLRAVDSAIAALVWSIVREPANQK
jgi:AcrR family transcriptional regulator